MQFNKPSCQFADLLKSLARDTCLGKRYGRACDKGDCESGPRSDAPPISRCEPGKTISDGIGAREHWTAIQVPENVLRELFYGTVASPRLARHGLQHYGVWVPLQRRVSAS